MRGHGFPVEGRQYDFSGFAFGNGFAGHRIQYFQKKIQLTQMIAVFRHALHAPAEAGFRHAVMVEHHAVERFFQAVAHGQVKNVAAGLNALHA